MDTCGEKDGGRCSNENMGDGSWWIPKNGMTKTEVERCYTKIHEGEMSTEREKKHKTENVENENWNMENAKEEKSEKN